MITYNVIYICMYIYIYLSLSIYIYIYIYIHILGGFREEGCRRRWEARGRTVNSRRCPSALAHASAICCCAPRSLGSPSVAPYHYSKEFSRWCHQSIRVPELPFVTPLLSLKLLLSIVARLLNCSSSTPSRRAVFGGVLLTMSSVSRGAEIVRPSCARKASGRICIYIYIYIYTHVYVCLSLSLYIYIQPYHIILYNVYIYIYVYVYIYIYIHTYVVPKLEGTSHITRPVILCWAGSYAWYPYSELPKCYFTSNRQTVQTQRTCNPHLDIFPWESPEVRSILIT